MNKILLIGCGYWGKNWYNTIMTSPYELVGVVDPNPVITVTVPLFNSIHDVNVEYTHAIIATNAELHLDLKAQLSIPDYNILVEKPCGIDSNRTEFNSCFPGYIFLSSPQYKYIKNLLDQQVLGKILYSRFERASMGPRIRTDVSIIEDYAIHDLYLYQALFSPKDVEIHGYLLNSFNHLIQADTLFLNVSNNDHVTTFFSSWRYYNKTRKIEIIGEYGSIIWENDNVYINNSQFIPINGYDSNRNHGYELTTDSTKQIDINITDSNLHLQLNDFINQINRNEIFINTNKFIWNIKEKLLF